MSVFHLVTLDFACGPHITEYGFDELTVALNGESSCTVHVSKIRPGAIFLTFPDRTFFDAELAQILERIQIFTSQFISVVLGLTKESAAEIKSKLAREGSSIEFSGRTVGSFEAGELFRVTGKRDKVNRFLSTCRHVVIDESNIVLRCTAEEKSFGLIDTTAVTEEHEMSEEEWWFLKWTHFDEMASQIHPQVRVKFPKPGYIQLSGDGGHVRKVIKEAHHFLDNRKVHTYYESKTIVECLKHSWCKDLLRRKWESAKIAATVVTDEGKNTAIIKSGGEVAIALHILKNTIKEAPPISLPKEIMFPVEASTWKSIEAAADGKAVAVLDEKLRQICVAGNAEEVSDVVEQIRKLVKLGKPSNALQMALRASPSIVEVVKRYHGKRISERACLEAAYGNSFAIRYTLDEFILEGDATAVKIAERELTSLMISIREIAHSSWNCDLRDRVSQVEQETRTLIQLLEEKDYGQRAIIMDSRSSAAVLRSFEEKDGGEKTRQAGDITLSSRPGQRTEDKGRMDYCAEGRRYSNLTLQVLKGSVCDQKADVLVNSITKNLKLTAGAVSMAFHIAAGRRLQEELYRKGAATEFSVLCTNGYDLKCKQVYHVVCGPHSSQQSDEKLKKLIFECLKFAEDAKMTSIAFPPIGAGGLGYPIDSVVEAFYKAVDDFNQERHQHLKSITCAIFDDGTLNDFKKVLLQLEARLPYKPESRNSVTYQGATEHGAMSADVYATYDLPIIWKITGLESDVARAVRHLEQLEDSENSQGIHRQTEAGSGNYEWNQGPVVSQESTLSFERKNDSARGVTNSGINRQSHSTSQGTLRNDESQSGRDSSLGMTTATYPQKVKQGYNMATSQSADDATDEAILVKHIASQLDDTRSSYARYWVSMGKETFSIFPVGVDQPEYREVKAFINDRHRSFNTDKMKIFRIQDKTQWKLYYEQQHKMKHGNPDAKLLQRMLWFSCAQDDVFGLLRAGHLLSRSNSVRQDCGKGAYFYCDATDAARAQVSTASTQGVNCIVLASVLTGRFVAGNASMITLPPVPGSEKKYDSSVDNMDNPKLFVIYHDAQACPLYCIYL